jgi:hypothetical protein
MRDYLTIYSLIWLLALIAAAAYVLTLGTPLTLDSHAKMKLGKETRNPVS